MTALLWNGDAFAAAAGLPFTDRCARYGMGLFETVRVRDGRAERLSEHLATLRAAASGCGFPDPAAALPAAWQALATLDPGRFGASPDAAGTLRIYLTAGDGAPSDPPTSPRLFLLFEPRPAPSIPPPAFSLAPARRFAPPHPVGTKSANYWARIDLLNAARADGYDEAILALPDGTICSAALGNLFVRIGGRWLTPDLASGCRPGTVRAWILEKRLATESTLREPALDEADAVCVTNSWIGIAPVTRIGNRALPDADNPWILGFDALR